MEPSWATLKLLDIDRVYTLEYVLDKTGLDIYESHIPLAH